MLMHTRDRIRVTRYVHLDDAEQFTMKTIGSSSIFKVFTIVVDRDPDVSGITDCVTFRGSRLKRNGEPHKTAGDEVHMFGEVDAGHLRKAGVPESLHDVILAPFTVPPIFAPQE